jgi:hypothetical protein
MPIHKIEILKFKIQTRILSEILSEYQHSNRKKHDHDFASYALLSFRQSFDEIGWFFLRVATVG